MTNLPTCPQDYNCNFTLVHPRVIYHTIGPWWQHTAGWIVAIVAILALAALLAYLTALVMEQAKKKADCLYKERQNEIERNHKLELEQQRTYQLDLVKGDLAAYEQLRKIP